MIYCYKKWVNLINQFFKCQNIKNRIFDAFANAIFIGSIKLQANRKKQQIKFAYANDGISFK